MKRPGSKAYLPLPTSEGILASAARVLERDNGEKWKNWKNHNFDRDEVQGNFLLKRNVYILSSILQD